ncbi:hypothetical protein ACLB9X_11545 [Streptomyces sp. 5K101]|uniref:hypothetical protein n=1 Tax=Streptomyces sp. 5K101 TaxID=3390037 RepID=UPI003975E5F5
MRTAPPQLPWCSARRRAAIAHEAPVFNPSGPFVRPYLVAHEQQERRNALELALDGVDVGPWVIHGHEVGMPVMGVAA